MPIELIAIVVGAIFLLWLVNYTQRITTGFNREYYRRKWSEIETLKRTSAAGARLAVIEADKLLDHALKDLKLRGQTMGDRLKSAGQMLGNQNDVWTAHKLRNQLAHEDAHPKPAEISRALNGFAKSLKSLGALK
ncbi:MAG TPA: hypothetical protein VGA08_03705 [Candidatus Saccharimonadales bacterium]